MPAPPVSVRQLRTEYLENPLGIDTRNPHLGWQMASSGRNVTQSAYQVQAVWQNPPEANWPAGGPFILWAVACPSQDRLYLLDAWLYAPGREKYEYMIQLQTILESFRCGS